MTSDKLTKTTASAIALASAPDLAPVEFVKSALYDMNQTPFTLGQIKVPSGGATVWTVETLEGEAVLNELEVVILGLRSNLRKWFREDFGAEAGPPDCSSSDGIQGYGVISASGGEPAAHDCGTCPWNQWGSDRGGRKGKDCTEYAVASVLRLDSLVPDTLTIPTGSLKAMQAYGRKLMSAGKTPWAVVTGLGLEKHQDGSLKWATVGFRYVRDLTADERAKMAGVSDTVRGWLSTADMGGLRVANGGGN